eukprot:7137111-Alexandrium_andersonii.AAC.1
MSASLVGSEMCIRDRPSTARSPPPSAPTRSPSTARLAAWPRSSAGWASCDSGPAQPGPGRSKCRSRRR